MSEAANVTGLLCLGGVFLYCAYLFYGRKWKFGAYTSLVASVFFFIMALPATRGFMRSTAWAAFVTLLEATGQGLVRLNDTIDGIRAGMEAEEARREAQQKELDEVQGETRQMQGTLRETQVTIEAQQKQIADLDQLMKSFYEAGTTNTFNTGVDSDQLVIVQHDDSHSTLYALLPKVPIRQTLELQYYVSLQPRNSYEVDSNLVTFRWGQSEEALRSKPLAFTFVPDPGAAPAYKKLETRKGRAYVDGRPLPYGYYTLDRAFMSAVPSGGGGQISWKDFEAAVEKEGTRLPNSGAQ